MQNPALQTSLVAWTCTAMSSKRSDYRFLLATYTKLAIKENPEAAEKKP